VVALKSVPCVIWLQSDLQYSLNYYFNGATYSDQCLCDTICACVCVCDCECAG